MGISFFVERINEYIWDTENSNIPTNLTLNNNNRDVVVVTEGYKGIQCPIGRSSGKYYFEVEVISGNLYTWYGVQIAGQTEDYPPGRIADSGWGWEAANERAYHDGSYYNDGVEQSGLITVMVAVDLDAGKIWWGAEGQWFDGQAYSDSDPAGTTPARYTDVDLANEIIHPAIGPYTIGTENRCNFKGSELEYAPPAGFKSWDDEVTGT